MLLTPQNVLFATIFFSGFMIVLLVIIIITLIIKNKRDREQYRWLSKTDVLITKAIFYDNEDNQAFNIPLNGRINQLLKRPFFRQTLINELVISSKSISGASGENLVSLYNQLNLEKDSEKSLQKPFWHRKAKAIQELAIMKQSQFSSALYKLTNHRNEFIRLEAQKSIVKFHGFEGLQFLDAITYPLSEWDQINLLKELSSLAAATFKGIDYWLKSKNDSVIIFALKLCSSYHQFDQCDNIVECLKHSNPKVRLQAIRCLKEIYEDTTSWHLMRIYNAEPKHHQIAILQALQEIASPDSTSFLEKQLYSDDNEIKLAATRALYHCGAEGEQIIDSHPASGSYPLNEIIQQIKMEK